MTAWVIAYQNVLLQGQWPPAAACLAMLIWLTALYALLALTLRRCHDQLTDWL